MIIKIIKCSIEGAYTENIGEEYDVLREVPSGYVVDLRVHYTKERTVIMKEDAEIIKDDLHRIDTAIQNP